MRGLFHLLLLPLLAACAQTGIDCNLTKVVQLPIEVQAHLLTVPVGINGKWTRLIVDSGAERTTAAALIITHAVSAATSKRRREGLFIP